ncbi:unnamed protein product [Polarella glacialis]|uniref:Prolyl 4-hydroxylase alpha subunit Fe(2+) 2OG dioxygenase domain-containing protein n=1 Tax=Polarella glacialis TaxID=89957 RepID=A0A813K300_POLGL|nr:unnamed protein product [Polarella glacialis]
MGKGMAGRGKWFTYRHALDCLLVLTCPLAVATYLWLQLEDLTGGNFEDSAPRFAALAPLLKETSLFPTENLERAGCHLNASTPPLMIVDNFFATADAEEIREKIMSSWAQGVDNFQLYDDGWYVSKRSSGGYVAASGPSHQVTESQDLVHRPVSLQARFSDLVGDAVEAGTSWDEAGDRWNGALHVKVKQSSSTAIHSHFHEDDVDCGWVGLVYLTHHAPAGLGTSFWMEARSKVAVKPRGRFFYDSAEGFQKLLVIEPVFNRLVLHRADLLHSGSPGLGAQMSEEPRLFATYFFNVKSHR